jgi:hypothetical protein
MSFNCTSNKINLQTYFYTLPALSLIDDSFDINLSMTLAVVLTQLIFDELLFVLRG